MYKKAWTVDYIKKMLLEKKGDYITIDESTYTLARNKARFIDNEFGEFWATPKNVITNNTDHPERGKIKKKQTNLNRFGSETYLQCKDFQKKTKKTLQQKYGVEHVSKVPEIIEKGIETKRNSGKYRLYHGKLSAEYAREQGISGFRISQLSQSGLTVEETINIIENPKHTDIEEIIAKRLEIEPYNKNHPLINYKPDFLIDNLCIECDGLYFHSSAIQDNRLYHFQKRKDFEEINQRVLQFRADEIMKKTDIVISIINNIRGQIEKKIYARNTKIQIVEHQRAIEFLNKNHLMGELRGVKHLGLFYQDELVTLLSYRNFKNYLKIERFASKINTVVVGGLSKLIKYIEKQIKPNEIYSWVDLRYGNGKSLEKLGFEKIRETLGFKWTDKNNTYNRLHCKANMDERGLSEKEHAEELKLFKIYDAGQRLYIKKLNN